jgi:hypothetical protein
MENENKVPKICDFRIFIWCFFFNVGDKIVIIGKIIIDKIVSNSFNPFNTFELHKRLSAEYKK